MPKVHIDTYDFDYLKKSTIGERLKFFRNQMMQYSRNSDKYTITALGSRLEVSPQTISSIERGSSKNPSFLLVHKLTKEYGVPLTAVTDEFYQGKEKLFAVGIPDDPIEVIDDPDLYDAEEIEVINNEKEDEDEDDFFEQEDTIGLLLYKSYDKDMIEPLLHRQIKNDLSKEEFIQLTSSLLFETSFVSKEPIETNKTRHPLDEAKELMESNQELLSSSQLIDLIRNRGIKKEEE